MLPFENNEPNVISEDLIRASLKAPDNASATETIEEYRKTVNLRDIEQLALSFKHILKIDNLRGMEGIVKLQLDNNMIEKINNLSHLENLTWLDLSFNKIAKIEGLNELTKLVDLSLFNNNIDVLENLDTLSKLTVLSLGNNNLKNLENVMYLRHFKNLRMVNLNGNPFCKDPEYKYYVIAHLKDLQYLDYRLVDKDTLLAAREQYQDELLELEERDEAEEARQKAQAELKARLELYEAANLSNLDSLLEKMLAEDPEFHKLKVIPSLTDSVTDYQEKYTGATEEIKNTILEQHKKKMEEKGLWSAAVRTAMEEKDGIARTLVENFEKIKKRVSLELRSDTETNVEEKIAGPKRENEILMEKLMELEMRAVDILMDLWREFDGNYTILIEQNKQHFAGYFGTLRMLENRFSEMVTMQGNILHEKVINGDLEDLDDDTRMVLQDKDTLLNIIQGSHDYRTAKIDAMEDNKVQNETTMYTQLTTDNRKWEITRNRERIAEIWSLIDRNRMELEEYLNEEDITFI